MKAVLPALARPLIEPHLPAALDVAWFVHHAEATALVGDADIAWIDHIRPQWTGDAIAAGTRLRWVNTLYAGLDGFPLPLLKERGTILTNGAGINALAVAEYAVMGVLAAAKRFDQVVRLADAHAWPTEAPGRIELFETQALIIGMGAIGRLIAARLAAFGVRITGVTRSGRDGSLTPDQWRDRLADFDWVIVAAPSTGATQAMIAAGELASMKRSAWIINIARGAVIDQDALIAALQAGSIAGAFLDTVQPEPLPSEHPLWSAPNTIHSMHLSGRSQTKMYQRATALFIQNLQAFLAGLPMQNVVDLDAGY